MEGCISNCLVFVIFVIILGFMARASYSMGPIGDMIGGYLPDDFGRKTVRFDVVKYDISVTVPRSWYLTKDDHIWWQAVRLALDKVVPLAEEKEWKTLDSSFSYRSGENNTLLPPDDAGLIILVDTDIARMRSDGLPTLVIFGGIDSFGWSCEEVKNAVDRIDAYSDLYFLSPDIWGLALLIFGGIDASSIDELDAKLLEKDALCGIRLDLVSETTGAQRFLEHSEPPDKLRVVVSFVPLNATHASLWIVAMAEERAHTFDPDLDKMFYSVSVK